MKPRRCAVAGSVRQLERQISSQLHTRTLMSSDKRAMLYIGAVAHPGDMIKPEEAIKDPRGARRRSRGCEPVEPGKRDDRRLAIVPKNRSL
jgi:hypothetical protein